MSIPIRRGTIIPVMDVRLRFSLDWKPYSESSVIIVLDVDGVPIGLAVNAVAMAARPGREHGIRGRRDVSADTAIRLGRHFGTDPRFWLNL